MRKKKCYIYTRVSTAAQTEGYSLEAQQERLREYADYKNLEIAGEYCDAGKSGKSIVGRPAFLQMLDDISSEKDNISFVLVFKLSRFGRNAADILKSLQLLEDYEVDLICVEDAIDSSTPGGKLTLTILSAVAEIERENINVQFMAGKMQKILNGGWPGGPAPYGYRSVNKELVVEPEEAEIVKLIFDRYIQDDGTLNGVAIWLNNNGYSRISKGEVKPFTYDFIVNVLDNPTYHGKINYFRRTNIKGIRKNPKDAVEVDGIHEAIIDEDLWQQAREKREASSGRQEKVDEPDRVSLLSGLIKCPACGNGLIATKNKHVNKNRGGHYKTIHYYSCRYYRKSAGRTCEFKHTYNQAKIDSAVFEIVSNLAAHPAFEKAMAMAAGGDESVEAYEKRMKEIRKDLYHQEHEKNRVGAELDNLDVLSDDYDTEYERIQAEMDDIYDRIESLELSLKKIKKKCSEARQGVSSIEGIKKILKNFGKFYEKLTSEEQRELYRQFIERIEVYPEEQEDGRVLKSIYFRFPVRYGETDTIETWIGAEDEPDDEIAFVLDCSEVQVTVAEAKATYAEIRAYVLEHTGMKVSSLYIAQIKRKYGIDVGIAYNKPEQNKNHVPVCPVEKELAIMDALKAFRMLTEDTEYMEAAV
ncbi:MAG: recombinase family protein [Mogibacterium sp.]|nr:recombinase family protein [Clostridia bacterium]MBQ6502184.1 recombinase family protein [Mogibacterium sp.]MBR6863066.1 recombinase family protein [Acidaminococcaceae bacterium]